MLLRNQIALNAAKEAFQSKWEHLEMNLAKGAPPVTLETKKKVVPRHAILCHQAFISLMILPPYAKQAIFVWVELPVLQHAIQDRMPQLKDQGLVHFVHREDMLQIMVQYIATFAVTINTNTKPMLQNAFQ